MGEAKIVITGAGGFLGRNLTKWLVQNADSKIVALTRRDEHAFLSSLGAGIDANRIAVVHPVKWDVVEKEIANSSILVNCAFPRNADGKAMALGLQYIDRIFESAGTHGGCSIINISSQSVYDQGDSKLATEEDELCLGSSYAVGKYAVELLLDAHCVNNRRTNIRLASLIGPGFDQRVINKMIVKAIHDKVLSIQENGSRFGYLDVRDAVEAIACLCIEEKDVHWDRFYNVGPDMAYSLTDIASSIQEVFGRHQGVTIELNAIKPSNPPVYSLLDSSRFISLTGWHSRRSLEESILEIYADLRQRSDG